MTLPFLALLFLAPAPQDAEPTHLGAHHSTELELPGALPVELDAAGALWVGATNRDTLVRVAPNGERTEFANLVDLGGVCAAGGTAWVSLGSLGEVRRLAAEGVEALSLGGFTQPAGLAVGAGRLWVADPGEACVWSLPLDDLTGSRTKVGADRLRAPSDVALLDDGSLLVSDAALHRVFVFDPTGALVREWGSWGVFPDLFSRPSAIDVAGDEVFVCDSDNHRVQVFSLEGKRRYTTGVHAIRPREGKGKLHYPTGLAVSDDGEWLVVSEPWDDRVQRFRRAPGAKPPPDLARVNAGQPSTHYGFELAASGDLMLISQPESRGVDLTDLRLVPEAAPVGDAHPERGEPVRVAGIGEFGTRLGFFELPGALWLDTAGRRAWICDPVKRSLTEVHLDREPEDPLGQKQEIVQFVRELHFDALGRDLPGGERAHTITPQGVTRLPDGRTLILCARNREVFVLDAALQVTGAFGGPGTGPGQFQKPVSLTASPDGEKLMVADPAQGKVCVFDGEFALVTELRGAPPTPLVHPYGVLAEPSGRMLVSDSSTSLLHVFEADGTHRTLGGQGIRRGELYGPRGLARDGAGRIYVMDHGNHRIVALDPELRWLSTFGMRLYTLPARMPETYKAEDYVE